MLSVFAVFLAACGGGGGESGGGPGGTVSSARGSQGRTNLFFLHLSTGRNLIDEGSVRGFIASYNSSHGTAFAFWDHGYNDEGLRNAAGDSTGADYSVPGDNHDPDGLNALWTSAAADWAFSRAQIMNNHQVIAFKSCFPVSEIPDAATLEQYKTWYLGMRSFFDAHPEKLFIVMSPPPLHRLSTGTASAANARAFAEWLGSPAYLAGHPNVAYFNLFDFLAHPSDGTSGANRLRFEYEIDHADGDSHPNPVANQTVGPVFAQFLIDAATNR